MSFVFLACFAIVMMRLNWLIANGGGEFTQGDWLVNLESGIVRRGLFGQTLIRFSDLTGFGLLESLGAIQALAVLAVFVGLAAGAWLSALPERLFLLLISPLLVIFWEADTTGAFRKELLGFLSFLPLLLRFRGAVPVAISASLVAILFAVAVFAHEANAFLAPALMIAVFLAFQGKLSDAALGAFIVGLGAIAVFGLGFATIFLRVESTAAMCDALVQRALPVEICGGAVDWMSDTTVDAFGAVQRVFASQNPAILLLLYVVLFLPAVLAFQHAPNKRRVLVVGLVVSIPFLPLYVIAIDWGRWMSMQMFAVTFIGLVLAVHADPEWLRRPVPQWIYYPVLLMSAMLGVSHYAAKPIFGFLPVVADIASRKLLDQPLLIE